MRNRELEYKIINECRKNLSIFEYMNEQEVYEWICNRFDCNGYLEKKVASLRVFAMAHKLDNSDWKIVQKYYLSKI